MVVCTLDFYRLFYLDQLAKSRRKLPGGLIQHPLLAGSFFAAATIFWAAIFMMFDEQIEKWRRIAGMKSYKAISRILDFLILERKM
ncbi:MAG: hypothetical protein R3E18_00590 [Sphingomonadaceae bacterium]